MAEEHNAIKYGTALSKAISTAVGGGYADVGVSRVSETLSPQFNPWLRPEWELLRGEILYTRSLTSPAVAARFSAIQVLSPPTSTKIVVIRKIQKFGGTPSLLLGVDTASTVSLANAVVNRGVANDTRFPNIGETSQTQLIVGDAASGPVFTQATLSTNFTFDSDVPFILRPASTLFIIADAPALAIYANIVFSERTPFPGELQARG